MKRIVNDSAISTFNALLNEANWSDVYKASDQGDANFAYAIFIEKYKSLYEQSFVKAVRVSKKRNEIKQSWMTAALLKSCKRKARLNKKMYNNAHDAK